MPEYCVLIWYSFSNDEVILMRFERKAFLDLKRIQSPKPVKGSDLFLNYLSSRSARQAKIWRLLFSSPTQIYLPTILMFGVLGCSPTIPKAQFRGSRQRILSEVHQSGHK